MGKHIGEPHTFPTYDTTAVTTRNHEALAPPNVRNRWAMMTKMLAPK